MTSYNQAIQDLQSFEMDGLDEAIAELVDLQENYFEEKETKRVLQVLNDLLNASLDKNNDQLTNAILVCMTAIEEARKQTQVAPPTYTQVAPPAYTVVAPPAYTASSSSSATVTPSYQSKDTVKKSAPTEQYQITTPWDVSLDIPNIVAERKNASHVGKIELSKITEGEYTLILTCTDNAVAHAIEMEIGAKSLQLDDNVVVIQGTQAEMEIILPRTLWRINVKESGPEELKTGQDVFGDSKYALTRALRSNAPKQKQ